MFSTVSTINNYLLKKNKIIISVIPQIMSGSIVTNGSSQWASGAANSSSALGLSNFSIEFWFYPQSNSEITGVVACGAESNGSWKAWYSYPGSVGKITVGFHWTTSSAVISQVLPLNNWYHIAVSGYNGSNITLYVNGVFSTSSSFGAINLSQSAMNIGRTYSDNPKEYFIGKVTNIRICKKVLYTGNFTVPNQTLSTSQSASTNIASLAPSECVLLLRSIDNGTSLTDSAQYGIPFTNYNTTWSNTTPFPVL
jgi:hypothetical protein